MISICVTGTATEFLARTLSTQTLAEFRSQFDPNCFEFIVEPKADYLLAVNHNKKAYRKFIAAGGSKERAILLRLEPDAVYPKQYKSIVTNKYGLVISPGYIPHNLDSNSFLGWPYQYHSNPAKPLPTGSNLEEVIKENFSKDLFNFRNWEQRSHTLVMIAGNKVSPVSFANYALRRKLAHTLPTSILEIYGPLWTDSVYKKLHHRLAVLFWAFRQGTFPNILEVYGNLFRSYPGARGMVQNKHLLLEDSKFSLVIENSNSIVTEKVIDSIVNGCIPIYIGSDLRKIDFPEDMVLLVQGEATEITDVISQTNPESIERHLSLMNEFILSKKFQHRWGSQSVYSKVAHMVINFIEESQRIA